MTNGTMALLLLWWNWWIQATIMMHHHSLLTLVGISWINASQGTMNHCYHLPKTRLDTTSHRCEAQVTTTPHRCETLVTATLHRCQTQATITPYRCEIRVITTPHRCKKRMTLPHTSAKHGWPSPEHLILNHGWEHLFCSEFRISLWLYRHNHGFSKYRSD